MTTTLVRSLLTLLLSPLAALAIGSTPQEQEQNAVLSAHCCYTLGAANACSIDSVEYQAACFRNIERKNADNETLNRRAKSACERNKSEGLRSQAANGYASCADVRAQMAKSVAFWARIKD